MQNEEKLARPIKAFTQVECDSRYLHRLSLLSRFRAATRDYDELHWVGFIRVVRKRGGVSDLDTGSSLLGIAALALWLYDPWLSKCRIFIRQYAGIPKICDFPKQLSIYADLPFLIHARRSFSNDENHAELQRGLYQIRELPGSYQDSAS